MRKRENGVIVVMIDCLMEEGVKQGMKKGGGVWYKI